MSAGIDFIALYRELGIAPECSPEDLKRAYRRRVSELHPDRTGTGTPGEEALKCLNLCYAAALDFHRAHGRFPGATTTRAPPPQRAPPTASLREVEPSVPDDASRPSKWLLLVLIVLLLIFVASQLAGTGDEAVESVEAAGPVPAVAETPARKRRAPPPPPLRLGMLPGEVVTLLGAPIGTGEDGARWHYGPSWVHVACGQVVDWYSSPLKPLSSSNVRPGPDDAREGYQRRVDCTTSAALTR